MKKNKMMRLASLLLVMVLMTTCVIGGTFAKYTTSVSSSDKARVAYWGFQSTNSMDLTGLFVDAYDETVDSVDGNDVIAPGTSGSTTFAFAWDESVSAYNAAVAVTGPEVAYTFTVAVEETIDSLIEENPNILWQLDENGYSTWDDMIADIKALSGDSSGSKQYKPNELPAEFTANDDVHTISWKWVFDENASNKEDNTANNDAGDTAMGNAAELDDCSITITITATQVD